MNNPKQTNILFHSIKHYDNLVEIINEKGFKASFADEVIIGIPAKLLMVSFSNVALLESRSQINYGDFSVGLTIDWGKRNNLEPVMYSYENSELGSSFHEIFHIAGKNAAIIEHINTNDDNNLELIVLDFRQILENSINMIMHLKPYKVTNKSGVEFVAYNDREWRFVHKHGDVNPLLFERHFLNNALSTEYEKAKSYPKPFTKTTVLNFDLEDLKYVVLEKKEQKKNIFNALTNSFGYDKVLEKILSGDLDILSRDTMWDNL